MNSVVVIVNIVLLVLNLLNLTMYSLERLYSIVVCLLFLLASIFLVWFIIERWYAVLVTVLLLVCLIVLLYSNITCSIELKKVYSPSLIASNILLIGQFLLFFWDVSILQTTPLYPKEAGCKMVVPPFRKFTSVADFGPLLIIASVNIG
uniref:NADH dehydrogenase subunit 6 n=1 Tax=Ditylenchus dipsaci TaxID=166011 RepID=A0A915CV05_9BILA